ncbi:MAG TPA: hypothetical protein ENK46_00835 [Flavobacteriia bacterium]|nr:hypothetical protein [Flavobacteriia bacterium]
MNKIIEKLLLKESYEFDGTITDFKVRVKLREKRPFHLKWISSNQFKVLSNFSLGTMIFNNNPGFMEGIKGIGKLTELNDKKTRIELSTRIRIEIYFIAALTILSPLVFFLTEEKLLLGHLFLFPATLIWFWIIYRFQEKILFKKVKNYIGSL